MTATDLTPQPPPPPPPPQSGPNVDFVQAFAFVFQDPRWVTKVLIGGLCYLFFWLVFPIFIIMGYCAKLCRNVVANEPQPLPEWDDFGGFLGEGLRLFAVAFCYVIPLFAIIGAFIIPVVIADKITDPDDISRAIAGGMASLVWCLLVPISLALSFWIPGALTFSAVEESFSAGFAFGRIARFIKDNLANYLIAFVIYLIARFAAGTGFLLFCIGVVLTAFWSMIVSTYGFASAYRLRK